MEPIEIPKKVLVNQKALEVFFKLKGLRDTGDRGLIYMGKADTVKFYGFISFNAYDENETSRIQCSDDVAKYINKHSKSKMFIKTDKLRRIENGKVT